MHWKYKILRKNTAVPRHRPSKRSLMSEFCQEWFSWKYNLSLHIRPVHLQEKPHECEVCQERFSQKANLNHHINAVHLKEKPHEYEFVKKDFHRKAVSKSTPQQSTSKRSLMSVKFARKDFHRKLISAITSHEFTIFFAEDTVSLSGSSLTSKKFFTEHLLF